jgi:hypothetical protein
MINVTGHHFSSFKNELFNNGSKSSLTILAGSLQINRTYHFQVVMTNLFNHSQQSIDYLTAQIQKSSSIVQIGVR